MTVSSVNAYMDQSTDANFRLWIAEIITALFTTVGLTQTSDTGQINTSTVVRPIVANTSAGYVIGRFNDSLQGTSPIFFKLEFGSGGTAPGQPNIWVTTGTGSNGSGTLTGTLSTRFSIVGGVIPTTFPSQFRVFNSRYCYTSAMAFFGFTFKIGAIGVPGNLATWLIGRTCDDSGSPTANAYMSITTGAPNVAAATGTAQCYVYASSSFATLTAATSFAWPPFAVTDVSQVQSAGKLIPFQVFARDPGLCVFPQLGVLSLVDVNSITPTILNIAMSGTTKHNMLSCGTAWGAANFGPVANGQLLMIYE